ncbi:MAG: exopolysaccharide biosynthesis polyprenyl glycosylphosphotransferase [Paludibacteraceae bacterium]|nr:exopolysaccharide biosynthesis polyprenyl glycosylphosphotransferase [Paludibacteraceae bacterium]
MKKRMMRHRLMQLLYVLVDGIAAELVWFAFLFFRWQVLDEKVSGWDTFWAPAFDFSLSGTYFPALMYPLGCWVIYYFLGYYLRPGKQRLAQLIWNTFAGAVIIATGAFFLIILDDVDIVDAIRYYKSFGALVLLQFIVILIPRLVLYYTVQQRSRRERVIISMTDGMTENDLYEQINTLFLSGKDIAIEPRLFDVFTGAARIIHIDESPLIMISDPKMADWELVVKHTFDVCVAAIGLVLLSPLFLIIALLVHFDSPGPVLYKQERVGFRGQTFNILKFRSMYIDAEADTPLLSKVDDARITKVGRFLRKYRLDELPQLWNILRGEMTIVGPRPERPYFVKQIMEKAPYYCLLYKVRPGLTSWGPVKVGYTDTMDKMLQRLTYDITYTENMSLSLDIKILLRTIGVLVDGKGQ